MVATYYRHNLFIIAAIIDVMNILLLGSGGREHAFAWKLKQSAFLTQLFILPGNAGTALCGINIDGQPNDFGFIEKVVLEKNINMVIVGPEEPLVRGIHDFFLHKEHLKHIPVIGPTQQGALLEGSKDFSKAFMQRHQIPTARYQTFSPSQLQEGYHFLETLSAPYVLKADGLAAGKGVIIAHNLADAKKQLHHLLIDQPFGNAASKVVIEEFLNGIELSVFILTDGESYLILPEAKDYKRIGENDTGPNTGGMGAVSPVYFADKLFMQKVEDRIIKPTIEGLKKEQINYSGFLFIGLMNVMGNPFVIEYNCRMGDPETESVMPRIQNDLVELFLSVGSKNLKNMQLQIDPRTSFTVMMVSGGYPEHYEKNKMISGLDQLKDVQIFHAGTALINNSVMTNGGRVLAVNTLAGSLPEAQQIVYREIQKIQFQHHYYRKDIGFDLK
jgi:phosphoribosylamine--glycine ligase